MQKISDSIQATNVADIVRRARTQSYAKRLTPEQERTTKGLSGILVPNAFQVPNEVVDNGWLRELGGAEVKVLLFIIRKTFGFNKIDGDNIPLSQIIQGTGLSRQAAVNAILMLEQCELVSVVRSQSADGTKQTNYYRLITRDNYRIKG